MTTEILINGAFWTLFLALTALLVAGVLAYIAYWCPRCPFCGDVMHRSTLNPQRAYCHHCHAVKDGDRYTKEGPQ